MVIPFQCYHAGCWGNSCSGLTILLLQLWAIIDGANLQGGLCSVLEIVTEEEQAWVVTQVSDEPCPSLIFSSLPSPQTSSPSGYHFSLWVNAEHYMIVPHQSLPKASLLFPISALPWFTWWPDAWMPVKRPASHPAWQAVDTTLAWLLQLRRSHTSISGLCNCGYINFLRQRA